MSLSATEIAGLVVLGAPVLFVDTCTVLDVVRDPTRDTMQFSDVQAGLALLSSALGGNDLSVLMAEQVRIELASNLTGVIDDAKAALARFQQNATRIDQIVSAFGSSGSLATQHFGGHVIRARAKLADWEQVAKTIPSNGGVTHRAFARVNAPRTPARKGKESMKDCVVIEAYLEAAEQLRAAGFAGPIVFASSNTREYYAPSTTHLQPDIAADLAAHNVQFAPNFGAAKHSLGL